MVAEGLNVLLLLFKEVDEHVPAETEHHSEEEHHPNNRRVLLVRLISVQRQVLQRESLKSSRF